VKMHSHFPRTDPGECPICGAAHSACGGGPITVVQLPALDAAQDVPMLLAMGVDPANLGDGSDGRPFSTATYRGTRHSRKKP